MIDDRQVNILVLTDRPNHWDKEVHLLEAPRITGNSLDPSIFAYSAVVLDIKNIEIKEDQLLRLRTQLQFCLKPIFLTEPIGSAPDALSDGLVSSTQEALERAQPICERLNGLMYDFHKVLASPLFSVLLYMYVRGKDIAPVKDWQSPAMYTYPEVELLIGFSRQTDDWLAMQVQRSLLEEGKLVDRVRNCPHCQLANPSYIDVCCNCRSIQIQQESFLHCFTCGAVKPEKEFKTQPGHLVCPQCSERLRHIGTDYDRPLENYTCTDCHSTFSDPLIVAVCPRCGKMTEPEDLEVKNYRNYSLTEKAIIAAKTGQIEEASTLFDSLDNVNYPYFLYLFSWLFTMTQRYRDDEFTIFAIRATNFDDIEENLGIARLLELVDEYITRVKSHLRTTDITSLGGKNDIWFLLPKTDLEGRKVVIERILKTKTGVAQKGSHTSLDFRIAAMTIPGESQEHDTPEKIIELIQQQLSIN
ncbi:hypothetical protein [Desulfosediminicola ganghwensis]|uniref:TackOD1 domain-containing metal-binding protein n=1 Tax=Desulfosediminicola ganghwensis TaxID=2569540 RepID=UPI0010ACDFEF|nr:hypothetical protein [Desulfosediminicola ganghwensis]